MDEPFGALDPQTKSSMQEMLLDLWRTEKTTVIFITHDIEEAIFLSQRIYVMQAHPGRIAQVVKVPPGLRNQADERDSDDFIKLKKQIHTFIAGGSEQQTGPH